MASTCAKLDLRRLAARASTLTERQRGGFVPVPGGEDQARERLASWRANAARGDAARFAARLSAEGLDEAAALRLLGDVRLADGAPLPAWTEVLERALAASAPRPVGGELPFRWLLEPWADGEDADLDLFKPSLLNRLALAGAPALLEDFSVYRALRGGALEALVRAPGETRLLRAWNGSFDPAAFYSESAALARALAELVLNWRAAAREFLTRLEADRPSLEKTFGPLGALVSVENDVSDPHHGGRRVVIASFASGRRLVYKPRGAGLSRAWEDFLGRLNDQNPPLAFRRRALHAPGPHVWLEYVEHAPCADAAAAERYFRRVGHWLALSRALRAADFHMENVVAAGEHPALIDVEILFRGREAGVDDALAFFQDSVAGTGLLPFWNGDGPDAPEIGGVGGGERGERRTWKDVNTDAMEAAAGREPAVPGANEAVLNGLRLDVSSRAPEIEAGFLEMGRFLAANPPSLADLTRQDVRVVLRPTLAYMMVLRRSLEPANAREGVDRSLALEALAGLSGERLAPFWPRERADLEALDVPCFSSRADGTFEGLFKESGAAAAARTSFDEESLAAQARLIRGSLLGLASASAPASAPRPRDEARPFDGAAAREKAEEIARDVVARAWRFDGRLAWVEPAYDRGMDRLKLRLLGATFYNGSAGIGFFLAARAAASGLADDKTAALQALAGPRSLERCPRTGGGEGTGGIVYALARSAAWLSDESLLMDARRLARTIDAEALKRDDRADVMRGAAGALLSLLALHRITPSDEWLARAVACGERLLDSPDVLGAEGFAHGASGAGAALCRLTAATGEESWRRAALEAFAAEDALPKPRMSTWCHGAPGWSLARAARLDAPPVLSIDYLCCGELGVVDCLLTSGNEEGARARGAALLAATDGLGFRLHPALPPGPHSPTFFGGTAGIGYQLLRLADPAAHPSALLWE